VYYFYGDVYCRGCCVLVGVNPVFLNAVSDALLLGLIRVSR